MNYLFLNFKMDGDNITHTDAEMPVVLRKDKTPLVLRQAKINTL